MSSFSHLENLAVFSSEDLLDKWYITCFAGVINESTLVRVWDKICGGSRKIVVFIFLELAKALSEKALKCNTRQEFKTLVEQVIIKNRIIIKMFQPFHDYNSYFSD